MRDIANWLWGLVKGALATPPGRYFATGFVTGLLIGLWLG